MIWESPMQQHTGGWLVFHGDRLIADLTLSTTDDPAYIFEVRLPSNNPEDLDLFTSSKRPTNERIFYKNKQSSVLVRDEEFLTNIYSVSPGCILVALRDFRLTDDPPKIKETC